MVKFHMVPGHVQSKTDGDTHYISAGTLAELYQLKKGEWEVCPSRGRVTMFSWCKNATHLYPSYEGRYGRPA